MEKLDFARSLRFLSYEDTLARLIEQAESTQNPDARDPLPLVKIEIGTQSYVGVPVSIQTRADLKYLALYQADGGVNHLEGLTIFPLAAISALTLLDLRRQLGSVTDSDVWSLDPAMAPSRLAVDRAKGEIDETLVAIGAKTRVEIVWSSESEKPEARFYMQALVTALPAALRAVTQDSAGKKALREIDVFALSFSETTALELNRASEKLRIVIGYKANMKKLMDQLKTALEQKL